MIVNRITAVTLSRTTEPTPADHTHHPGTAMWRVEWTRTNDRGKADTLRQSHYTEADARRHARNLVAQRRDGLTVEDVYSENVDG